MQVITATQELRGRPRWGRQGAGSLREAGEEGEIGNVLQPCAIGKAHTHRRYLLLRGVETGSARYGKRYAPPHTPRSISATLRIDRALLTFIDLLEKDTGCQSIEEVLSLMRASELWLEPFLVS